MQDGEILRNVVQRLQAELGDDLKGVLAGGSRLRGEADANSDIDVVVVIGEPKRRRQNLTIDGVEVECSSIRPFRCGDISNRIATTAAG